MTDHPIAFLDLKAQQKRLGPGLRARIEAVLAHCQFILGPEVGELETRLAQFCGASHGVAVSSGTDALQIALMAEGVGPGDAVFLPAFTYTATAEVALVLGATPVFVDIDARTFQIDPAALAAHRGLALLGADPLGPDAGQALAAGARSRSPIRSVLLDQTVLAGLGNIYANEALALALYRAVQECLTNIVRHAGASALRVRLRALIAEDGGVRLLELTIADNGRGFAPDQRFGFGLLGIAERVRALGGRIETGRAAEGGALVRLTLPLGPAKEKTCPPPSC